MFYWSLKHHILTILERPFLARANTVINCMNGVVNLSFGNMTLKINVFNVCKQPIFDIVDLTEEACRKDGNISFFISDPLEMAFVTDIRFFDKYNLYDAI